MAGTVESEECLEAGEAVEPCCFGPSMLWPSGWRHGEAGGHAEGMLLFW